MVNKDNQTNKNKIIIISTKKIIDLVIPDKAADIFIKEVIKENNQMKNLDHQLDQNLNEELIKILDFKTLLAHYQEYLKIEFFLNTDILTVKEVTENRFASSIDAITGKQWVIYFSDYKYSNPFYFYRSQWTKSEIDIAVQVWKTFYKI